MCSQVVTVPAMHLGKYTTSGVLKLLRLTGQDAARTASLRQRGSALRLLALQLHEADAAVPLQRRAARGLLAALFRRPADGVCSIIIHCNIGSSSCTSSAAARAVLPSRWFAGRPVSAPAGPAPMRELHGGRVYVSGTLLTSAVQRMRLQMSRPAMRRWSCCGAWRRRRTRPRWRRVPRPKCGACSWSVRSLWLCCC